MATCDLLIREGVECPWDGVRDCSECEYGSSDENSEECMGKQKTADTQQASIEKHLKKVICKVIAEESGDPNDFQEGYCVSISCPDCMFSKLPKAIMDVFHIDIKEKK